MLVVKIRSDPGLDLPTHRQSDCCRSRKAPGVSNLSTGKPPARSSCFKSSLFAPSCERSPPPERRTRHGPQTPGNKTTSKNSLNQRFRPSHLAGICHLPSLRVSLRHHSPEHETPVGLQNSSIRLGHLEILPSQPAESRPIVIQNSIAIWIFRPESRTATQESRFRLQNSGKQSEI